MNPSNDIDITSAGGGRAGGGRRIDARVPNLLKFRLVYHLSI